MKIISTLVKVKYLNILSTACVRIFNGQTKHSLSNDIYKLGINEKPIRGNIASLRKANRSKACFLKPPTLPSNAVLFLFAMLESSIMN
jgi:hypothetical protein